MNNSGGSPRYLQGKWSAHLRLERQSITRKVSPELDLERMRLTLLGGKVRRGHWIEGAEKGMETELRATRGVEGNSLFRALQVCRDALGWTGWVLNPHPSLQLK